MREPKHIINIDHLTYDDMDEIDKFTTGFLEKDSNSRDACILTVGDVNPAGDVEPNDVWFSPTHGSFSTTLCRNLDKAEADLIYKHIPKEDTPLVVVGVSVIMPKHYMPYFGIKTDKSEKVFNNYAYSAKILYVEKPCKDKLMDIYLIMGFQVGEGDTGYGNETELVAYKEDDLSRKEKFIEKMTVLLKNIPERSERYLKGNFEVTKPTKGNIETYDLTTLIDLIDDLHIEREEEILAKKLKQGYILQ